METDPPVRTNTSTQTVTSVMVGVNAIVASCLAIYFLLISGALVIWNLCDPALRTGHIPRKTWRLHRYLALRYER